MRSTGAGAAVVERAHFTCRAGSLNAAYQGVGDAHWVARRQRNGRIRWTLCPAAPKLAAP
jgi:hypothetical protein